MALESDTVDLDAPRLDKLDDAQSTLVLGVTVLEVIVVVEQLGCWVGGSSHAEGDGKVLLSNDAEEDVVSVRTVLVQCCVFLISLYVL